MRSMASLLYLVHRLPYPPNKGDKIRSFNLLKYLARDYQVYLGAFVDDVNDWHYQDVIREYCADVFLLELSPAKRKIMSLFGLLSGEALTLPYYRSDKMKSWVQEVIKRHGISHILVYSSAMAQYVSQDRSNTLPSNLHRVIDFVDVDSEKWRQYSQQHRWPLSWIYEREGRKLLDFERRIATEFDVSVFVSSNEAALFTKLVPEAKDAVHYIENGVDTDYFSPHHDYTNPYAADEKVFVFTGAMDYWANIDAVTWFAEEVFPFIQTKHPASRFYIVGSRPTAVVSRLAERKGVRVTGAVKDIRPYLHYAVAAVAPLRIARGIQNKVLEAMAMAKPVLATPAAIDGIRAHDYIKKFISDDPRVLAKFAHELLVHTDSAEFSLHDREHIVYQYDWMSNLARFEKLLNVQQPESALLGAVRHSNTIPVNPL